MLYHLMVQVHNSLHPGQILWGGIGNGCQPGLTVPLHPIPDPQTGHKPDKMIPDALLQKKDITVRGRNCWGLGAGGGSLVGWGDLLPTHPPCPGRAVLPFLSPSSPHILPLSSPSALLWRFLLHDLPLLSSSTRTLNFIFFPESLNFSPIGNSFPE